MYNFARMNTRSDRILIVDDEADIRDGLRMYLQLEGYEADTAASAEEALARDIASYSLILLDIMMDGMSGIDMARRLRESPATASVPVIFLTARDSADDVVDGLGAGADDYIAKPFSMKILIARIKALLRRTAHAHTPAGIVCDRHTLSCRVDGSEVKLTRKEFEILALMLENPGRIFTRDELIQRVWPENVCIVDRSVDVHVTRIRSKIAPYGKNIVARSGYGYGWQE